MQDPVAPTALVTDPNAVAAVLAGTLAAVFALERVPALARLFAVLPAVLWAYFVPMLLTTAGVTPATSAAYDWFSYALLPLSLFLLMLTMNLRAVLALGWKPLAMMLVGTAGIVLGGPLAYLAVGQFIGDPDAWMGFAALSGSWIGGTANMVAIQESIGLADLGPIIVVDTVVGYGWMAILLFLSAYQARFDRWTRADTSALDAATAALDRIDQTRRPISTETAGILVGLGLAVAVASRALSERLPDLGPTETVVRDGVPTEIMTTIIGGSTWAVLIAVTVGLALSFTRLRRLEADGASRLGYAALYLLLTSIGAKADLAAVLDAPLYLLAGVVWLSFHIALLLGAAKLLRAPLFFVATGSMANVGGAASAPVVASVYHPAMAPVGLLLAVAGYVLGIYGGIACAWLLRLVAGG